jgi:hypothetical protein
VEADDWTELGPMHSSPDILSEVIQLYLACNLRPAAQSHETHEIIEIHKVLRAEEGWGRLHERHQFKKKPQPEQPKKSHCSPLHPSSAQ